jgi:rhodanese-related sulfurtransferase
MIKQLASKDIKSYLMAEPNSVLLDVRTKEEWEMIGKPDGEKIGLKTYFLEIKRDAFFDFSKEFKNFNISQDNAILVICKSGERSQISAELLFRDNYKAINISDGFEGSTKGAGWINCGLPIKF